MYFYSILTTSVIAHYTWQVSKIGLCARYSLVKHVVTAIVSTRRTY